MKAIAILFLAFFGGAKVHSQKFSLEKSTVIFFSDGLIEDISATNKKSIALIDISTGEVAFQIPIKDFEFERDLMKQHFNEKYLETEKYPKASFGAKLSGFDKAKTGTQQVIAEGKLTIHGVTKEVKIPGTIELTGTQGFIKAKFMVKLADYKIKIPTVVFKNIAEEVEVTVDFTLKQN